MWKSLSSLPAIILCAGAFSSSCQAQIPDTPIPDTVITVTKLPYPEARIFAPQQQGPPKRSAATFTNGEAQSTSSEAASITLQACIHLRHARLRSANLATLTATHKKDWLKYLPSVSAGLSPTLRRDPDGNFTTRLTPTLSVGLNSSLLYTAHRDKQQRAATRESIIQRSQLQEDQEIAQLHRLLIRLQTETDKLNLHAGVTDIDRQLFNLYQQQYDNHDITPEEYLLKRKAFLLQELRNQDQITRIEALRYEIDDLAGCLDVPPPVEELPSRK